MRRVFSLGMHSDLMRIQERTGKKKKEKRKNKKMENENEGVDWKRSDLDHFGCIDLPRAQDFGL